MRMIILLALIAASAVSVIGQPARRTTMNMKVFETVWSTVNKEFYDPNFNGVDWKAAHEKYAPLARAAASDDELYKRIMEMLGLLKVSHMEAGPASAVKTVTSKPSTVGIGLRMVEGKLTITRIVPRFPAEHAGVRTGFIVTAIDGKTVASIDEAKKLLAGEAGSTVRITFLDNIGEREIALERQSLAPKDGGKMAGLNFYALFDSKIVEGDIGYISFTSFVPFLNEQIHSAMTSMKNAPGMVLDLRGNGGGDDNVALGIANRLFAKQTLLMVTRRRTYEDNYYKTKPVKYPYLGKLVVLIDEFSGSATEQLAAGLQESDRAYVIGTKSAGEDLDANIKMLPDGGMLVYAYGLPHTPKGFIIEGRGVIPDQVVELKRADLLAGHDTQLDAAIAYLRGRN